MDRSGTSADAGPADLRRALAAVESPGFAVAFRGYDPVQVHALLDRVAVALRSALERPHEPVAPVPVPDVLGELTAVVSAEVHRFRERARVEADAVVGEAEACAARLVADAESHAAALLAAAREQVAALLAAARQQAPALVRDAGRAREVAPGAERPPGPAAAGAAVEEAPPPSSHEGPRARPHPSQGTGVAAADADGGWADIRDRG